MGKPKQKSVLGQEKGTVVLKEKNDDEDKKGKGDGSIKSSKGGQERKMMQQKDINKILAIILLQRLVAYWLQGSSINLRDLTREKCFMLLVSKGTLLAMQIPAMSVSGMLMPVPFSSSSACIFAVIFAAFESKERMWN